MRTKAYSKITFDEYTAICPSHGLPMAMLIWGPQPARLCPKCISHIKALEHARMFPGTPLRVNNPIFSCRVN